MGNHDALLDAYGRLLRALMVLHGEAESDLDFDAWVELADMRYDAAVQSFTLTGTEEETP